MARHAGYRTIWLSVQNNAAVSQIAGLIAGEAHETLWLNNNKNSIYEGQRTGDFDNLAVTRLAGMDKPAQPTLYIVHLLGSHRRYDCRYPLEFNIWDEKANLSNAYDNSILYHDYIMKELYRLLVNNLSVDAMLYFSDHGEETQKYFNHGTDYFLPNYRKNPSVLDIIKIPVYMCFSANYMRNHPQKIANLNANRQKYFSNDMIYDTLLGIMDIKCCHYASEQDLTSEDYAFEEENLRTMHGMLKVIDILQ